MKIKLFTIPNLLTLSNLLCGSFAAVSALKFGNLEWAFWFMAMAAVFDFFDGFVARLLNCPSPIGVQLDSLADMISFGFAPAAVLFTLYGRMSSGWIPDTEWIGYAVFLFTACAALRLAVFNIDQTQRDEFLGLPSPAAALFCASLGWISEHYGIGFSREAVLVVGVGMGVMMLAAVRMFALKFHGFGWRGNELRYLFMALSALSLLCFHGVAVPFVILLYIVISLLRNLACLAKECRKAE